MSKYVNHINASASHDGWLKLYREIMRKPLWTETTAEQKVLLFALLMRAAYTKRTWVYRCIAYHLKPGQLVTSINSLVEMGGEGVTHRKVRTALSVLEKYGFLTQKATKHNTIITIENWDTYQNDGVKPTQEASQQRHGSDTTPSHGATSIKKLRSKERVDGVEQQHREQRIALPKEKVEKKKEETEEKKEKEENRVAGATQWWCCSEINQNQVLLLYQDTCLSLPRVRIFSEKRRQAITKCWETLSRAVCVHGFSHEAREGTGHETDPQADLVSHEDICNKVMGLFTEIFEAAEATAFLKGVNEKGWKADFDWLMKPDNMMKVLENKYQWETPIWQHSSHQASHLSLSHSGRHSSKAQNFKAQDQSYRRVNGTITGFHLPEETRRERYSNEQLEAILLKKKVKRDRADEMAVEKKVDVVKGAADDIDKGEVTNGYRK